jgi:hypothetical protein
MSTPPVKSDTSIINNISDSLKSTQNSVSQQMNQYSSPPKGATDAASSGFFTSNGIIAKFVFLILVIIVFLVALNLGIRLVSYFLTAKNNTVTIINGMIDGNSSKIIQQNPKVDSSVIIRRSNNQTTGIEFSWSVWLRLDGFPTGTVKYQPIFVQGDSTYNSDNISTMSNGPGVYFSGSNPNSIRVMMDTQSLPSSYEKTPSTEIIDLPNIPIKKWFHLLIRCQNKYLDVYINGLIVYRTNLANVPLQNYDNIRVCPNGGFIGKLSNLIYYDRALNIIDINSIVSAGPNTSNADSAIGNYGTTYLSTLWYK